MRSRNVRSQHDERGENHEDVDGEEQNVAFIKINQSQST